MYHPMMRRNLFFLGCLPLVLACGHDCDDMGCIEGVTLELATPLTAEGEYTFTVTTESTTTTCVAHIPLRRDGTEPPCDQLSIHRRQITTHGDGAVHGVAGDEIEAMGLSGHHDALSVTISHEGTVVLEANVTPEYRGVEINGPGCGECPMATHTIDG